jgi:hypothetical protein
MDGFRVRDMFRGDLDAKKQLEDLHTLFKKEIDDEGKVSKRESAQINNKYFKLYKGLLKE